MKTYPLQISSPEGVIFKGDVVKVKCRTITGDLAILAGHINYCTALGMGEAVIELEDGNRRSAACIGGMLSVMDGECHILATTWEFAEDIDLDRAKAALERAEKKLKETNLDDKEMRVAKAKLQRAMVRIGVRS